MNLQNKNIIVTGGASGIGLETAIQLKNKGANVIICGRNEDKLKLAGEKFGLEHKKCDVSQESDVLSFYQYFNEKYDNLDVLINNAGFGIFSKLEDTNVEEFKSMYDTNVTGAMLMGREAAKLFIAQSNGAIINIASTAALKGFPGGGGYAGTKFALRGMTECWRAELRPHNIRVILINPSEVQTPFFGDSDINQKQLNPTKLTPDHIAHSIIATLEMGDAGFIPELTIFATNPK